MSELGQFEGRLATAVRAFADRADTRVDPMAVADRAVGRRRIRSIIWFGNPLPVRVSILVLLGLLLALLAWSSQVGAPWDQRTSIVPPPLPSATVNPPSAPTPAPSTDATGDEHVIGAGTFSILDFGTSTTVGDVEQVRGFVATFADTMNDARVTGTGTLRLSIDTYGTVGSEWGTCRLVNDGGAWEGPVSGATWGGGDLSDLSGLLVGRGAYSGYTYHAYVHSSGFARDLVGIIYPGSPPGQ
jgi:hypothetical protein